MPRNRTSPPPPPLQSHPEVAQLVGGGRRVTAMALDKGGDGGTRVHGPRTTNTALHGIAARGSQSMRKGGLGVGVGVGGGRGGVWRAMTDLAFGAFRMVRWLSFDPRLATAGLFLKYCRGD